MKSLFGFSGKDFAAFVLPPACLCYANTITHTVWALTCSPLPSILTVLEQCVATVRDFDVQKGQQNIGNFTENHTEGDIIIYTVVPAI